MLQKPLEFLYNSMRTQQNHHQEIDPHSNWVTDPLPPTQGPVSVSSKLSYTKVKAKSFSSLNKIQVFKYWMEIIFFLKKKRKKKPKQPSVLLNSILWNKLYGYT